MLSGFSFKGTRSRLHTQCDKKYFPGISLGSLPAAGTPEWLRSAKDTSRKQGIFVLLSQNDHFKN
jgi:hypothetical protein